MGQKDSPTATPTGVRPEDSVADSIFVIVSAAAQRDLAEALAAEGLADEFVLDKAGVLGGGGNSEVAAKLDSLPVQVDDGSLACWEQLWLGFPGQ